jgi:zinc D-Ala-D-Ala dipeptidase/carboxypeptidase
MKTVSLSRNMIHTGHLILVNRDYPYHEGLSDKTLAPVNTINKDVLLECHFASVYNVVMNELCAKSKITAVSGWRSQQEQEQIYSDSIFDNGADFTAKYVALPGHSEHQTGFAVDLALNQPDIDFLRPYFPHKGVCEAFRKTASKYGIIERYPEGKENITGISYESWHFRYVGAPHAMLMEQIGDTLEEYHERIKHCPYCYNPLKYDFSGSKIEISYLPADKEIVTFEIESNVLYSVSGNNIDGFIITVWRVG